jgi:glycerol-3-phosphate acyltransferase PlsY
MDLVSAGLAALGAYLVGGIPFGLLLGRALRGVDIRQLGSRNLGATNAFRVLGPRIGVAVFALDALKGLLPVLAARRLAPGGDAETAALAAGVAAILGHVFPVYLGFRGGKGVATSAGVLAALAPLATAVAFGVWVATVAATRYVSLGSILAAITLPATILAREGRAAPRGVTGAALAAAVLVIVRHRANLGRLLAGTEPRFRRAAAAGEGARPEREARAS